MKSFNIFLSGDMILAGIFPDEFLGGFFLVKTFEDVQGQDTPCSGLQCNVLGARRALQPSVGGERKAVPDHTAAI